MAFLNDILRILTLVLFLCLPGYSLYGQEIQWYDFEQATQLASEDEKPIFLFMEAEWCGFCKKMHREVFTDSTIQDLMTRHFYSVRIDIESKNEIIYNGEKISKRAFSKSMKLQATPTIIFLQSNHTVIGSKAGYMDENELSTLLRYIFSNQWEHTTLQEYQNKLDNK